MVKFKIEYDPSYSYKYAVYRYEGWRKGWNRISSFETEEQATEELKKLVMFPKIFIGDKIEGIYNKW